MRLHREGRDGARCVAEGDEDATARERVDRNVDRRLADAVNHRLDALAAGDLHHLSRGSARVAASSSALSRESTLPAKASIYESEPSVAALAN